MSNARNLRADRSRFLSRRQFLAAGAAVAVAAPSLLPASALGRDGHAPPSERIGMGFIGLGGQGTGHLLGGAWTYVPGGYIARDDVQVLAVCDVRRERRDQAHQRCNQIYAEKSGQAGYSGVQAYNDFREVLARPDIDAVLLALPYHWAALMATMALRAGKDVYCEKPICTTIREGRNLVETCRRFGRVYQAGMQQRSEYDGKFRQACDLVRNGRIGRLQEVYAYRSPGAFVPSDWTSDESQPVPEGFDWDMWLGPLPWRPYSGGAGHALSGFFVGDVNWSPHHYDIVRWTINPDPAEIVAAWPERGADCGRSQQHRLLPGEHPPGTAASGRCPRVSCDEPLRQFPRLHPHAAAHDLRAADRRGQYDLDPGGRHRPGPGAKGQVGSDRGRIPRRRPGQPSARLHPASPVAVVSHATKMRWTIDVSGHSGMMQGNVGLEYP